jgi:hypothetical protein
MKVVAAELGNRPLVWTKARRFAPQGLQILADLFEHFEFADVASIALDWSNVLELQPEEVAKPVIVIETIKFVGEMRLTVQVRLDVDSLFGNDEVTANDLVMVIQNMESKTLEALEAGYER